MIRVVLAVVISIFLVNAEAGYKKRPDRKVTTTTEVKTDVDVSTDVNIEGSTTGDQSNIQSVGDVSLQGGQTIVEGDTHPDSIKIRNTPSMVAPDIYPTVSCFKGASGSASVPGIGLSLGAGKIDKDCVKREYIRLAYAMGLINRATYMWCQQQYVWEDFGTTEDCLLFAVDEEAEPIVMAQVSEEEFKTRTEALEAQIKALREELKKAQDRYKPRSQAKPDPKIQKDRERQREELRELKALLERDYERVIEKDL